MLPSLLSPLASLGPVTPGPLWPGDHLTGPLHARTTSCPGPRLGQPATGSRLLTTLPRPLLGPAPRYSPTRTLPQARVTLHSRTRAPVPLTTSSRPLQPASRATPWHGRGPRASHLTISARPRTARPRAAVRADLAFTPSLSAGPRRASTSQGPDAARHAPSPGPASRRDLTRSPLRYGLDPARHATSPGPAQRRDPIRSPTRHVPSRTAPPLWTRQGCWPALPVLRHRSCPRLGWPVTPRRPHAILGGPQSQLWTCQSWHLTGGDRSSTATTLPGPPGSGLNAVATPQRVSYTTPACTRPNGARCLHTQRHY